MSVWGFLRNNWAQGWGMYISKYKFVLDMNCQHFGNIIRLKLYIEGFGNIHISLIVILDIGCQHLGNTYQLNLHSGIGYILPTIGGYMSVGGFLPQGPTVRGPIVHPEKVDSWAPGPNCPGPNCPGPNCPPLKTGQLGPGQLRKPSPKGAQSPSYS